MREANDATTARRGFLALWLVVFAIKLALAARLPLFVDEAFYWQEGRHLAWAYSDLPGLSAWLAAVGDAIAPGNVLALRWPFLLVGAAVPWVVARMTMRELDARSGWWAGSLALLLPLAGTLGLLALPDAPMLLASVLNINSGIALSATQLLFVTFLIGIFPALAISADTPEAGTMDRPPRDSSVPILNSSTLPRWLLFGVVQGGIGIFAFWLTMRQGESVQVAQTMVFAVMGWSTVLIAAGLRRDVTPIWNGPYLPYFLWLAVPLGLTWLAVESELLQPSLDTVSIGGATWWLVLALALVPLVIIEVDKYVRRLRSR